MERVPKVEVLLETHNDSLADDPGLVVRIVRELRNQRAGLLFQPTLFQDQQSVRKQFHIQRPYIRHVHLQNRMQDLSFARMEEGVVPWPELLAQLETGVDATLEFVPAGIFAPEQFDLNTVLDQARAEADYVSGLVG